MTIALNLLRMNCHSSRWWDLGSCRFDRDREVRHRIDPPEVLPYARGTKLEVQTGHEGPWALRACIEAPWLPFSLLHRLQFLVGQRRALRHRRGELRC